MRKTSVVAVLILVLNGLLWLPAVAVGDDTTQLDAHEHGRGVLNIAIEDMRVDLMLEVAGHDVVGFEHAAGSDEERSMVARAKLLLRDPLKVFGPDAAASCEMTASDVHFTAEHSEHHDHDDHHGKHDDHDDHDEKHDEHHDHGDEHGAGHGEVHASYTLDCKAPQKLSTFRLTIFDLFPRAERIDVNVVTDAGQVRREVSREKPDVVLADGA